MTFYAARVRSLIADWFETRRYPQFIGSKLRSSFDALYNVIWEVPGGTLGLRADYTVGTLAELLIYGGDVRFFVSAILGRCSGPELLFQDNIWRRIIQAYPKFDIKHVAATVIQKHVRRGFAQGLFRRKVAAVRVIQRGCYNWLWSPRTRDGKEGIHLRLIIRNDPFGGVSGRKT